MIRERLEANESIILCEHATFSAHTRGRQRAETQSNTRTCFMRDRDRIIHSKAFRRLKHKTQVFVSPEGDHYRTRLTHTLEVSQISRTIAKGLRLNEDLAEAIALGHDLGHTAFGHAGERALNEICPLGFAHNEQSLRVVDFLENSGEGLNLTYEVRDGICCHTGTKKASTSEGRIVHYADQIAYINHDVDDAVRAGILRAQDIPRDTVCLLGSTNSARINSLVEAVINYGEAWGTIGFDEETGGAMEELRDFMFARVYQNSAAKIEEHKGCDILHELYTYYVENADDLPSDYMQIAMKDGAHRAACDYVSGMTDHFAVAKFQQLHIPKGWEKL